MRLLRIPALTAALVCGLALSQDYPFKSLTIEHPFARATPPGATVGGAYMTIRNRGTEADRLVRAASPFAGVVDLHEMRMDGGVMKMGAVSGIEIKPGSSVELKPGGFHVMLQNLKQPLKQGENLPLSLTFEKTGTVEVQVKIKGMAATSHH